MTIVPAGGLTAWVAEATANYPSSEQVELCSYPVVAAMVTAAGEEAGCGTVLVVTSGGVIRPLRDQVPFDAPDAVLIGVQAAPPEDGWAVVASRRLRHKFALQLLDELREVTTAGDLRDVWADLVEHGLDNDDYAHQLRATAAERIQVRESA